MYNREMRLTGLNFLRLSNNKLIQPFHLSRFGRLVRSLVQWQFFHIVFPVIYALCEKKKPLHTTLKGNYFKNSQV